MNAHTHTLTYSIYIPPKIWFFSPNKALFKGIALSFSNQTQSARKIDTCNTSKSRLMIHLCITAIGLMILYLVKLHGVLFVFMLVSMIIIIAIVAGAWKE